MNKIYIIPDTVILNEESEPFMENVISQGSEYHGGGGDAKENNMVYDWDDDEPIFKDLWAEDEEEKKELW